MKLHLEQKFAILNSPPEISPIQHMNFFIYYSSKHVIISDLLTGRIIHKFKYDDITVMSIHNNHLYIFNSDIYILDLSKFEIIDIVKLSKALISKVSLFNDQILIAKTNKKISLLKMNGTSFRKIFEITIDNFCEGLFLGEDSYGYFDSENIVVYSSGSKIRHFESEGIVSVHSIEREVYAILTSGQLIEILSDCRSDIGRPIDNCCFSDDRIHCISDGMLIEVTYNGEIISEIDLTSAIEEYSGVLTDYFSTAKEQGLIELEHLNNAKRMKQTLRKDEYESNFSVNDSDIDSNYEEVNIKEQISNEQISNEQISNEQPSDEQPSDEQSSEAIDNSDYNSLQSSNKEEEGNYDDFEDTNIENTEHSDIENNSTQNTVGEEDDVESLESLEKINMAFAIINPNTIKTSENDHLFILDGKITKIISFADDTTDAVTLKDNLILSTTSGYLKFTSTEKYTDGEYLLDAKLIKIHHDSITTCKLAQNILLTGSKDKSVSVLTITFENTLKFTKVFEFACFEAEIVSIAYEKDMLAVATADLLLHVFQVVEATHGWNHISKYFDSFEKTHVAKVHSKAINHILLTSSLIITSSSDKTAKIFDHSYRQLKIVQSDKVLHTSFNDKFIAICSHKGVKVIKNPDLSPVCSFHSKRPVISSCFYNGYLVAVSDVIRIYDIEKAKCVKSYDFGTVNSWTFTFPFICGENKIVGLKDESVERAQAESTALRELAQNAMLLERFLFEKRFEEALDVLLRRGDDKRVYQVISQGYFETGDVEFLDRFMKNGETKNRIFEILMKNSGLKQSFVFNVVLGKYFIGKIEKGKRGKIREIVEKHVEAIDEIFIDLLGI